MKAKCINVPNCSCTSFLPLMAQAHKFMQQHILFTTRVSNMLCCNIIFRSCKPRIGGRQCDRCAPGYYRFPDCVPCDCNRGGVTPGVCHPDTGRCLCKVRSSCSANCRLSSRRCLHWGWVFNSLYCMIAHFQRNVAGVKCDACSGGSFHFDPSSRSGCTSCFCFGATDRCQSSSKRRGKVCLCYCAAACCMNTCWEFRAC